MHKKRNCFTNFSAKKNPVESIDHATDLPDATWTEVSSKSTDEVSGSKAEKHKFEDVWKSEFSWLQ